MSKQDTIAFVHGTYYPENERIDTMPFVLNSLRHLAAAGWPVDVFLWEQPCDTYARMLPASVSFQYQRSNVMDSRTPNSFRQGPGYRCVFGVGQMGACAAAVIAQRNNCPLVLLNNEFPSQWGTTPFVQAERAASRQAALLVVPDECRATPLLTELSLPLNTPCVTLPNGPLTELPVTNIDWHERLAVPREKVLCLNAGSISDFAQVPELMTTVPLWPERAVLVLNERNQGSLNKARHTFAHLQYEDRIVWNPASLTEEELHSLVASSALNFALYRNTGPNIEYAGFSSGKLMRSLAAGVPVIASNLLSFQFIEKHRLGRLVRHPMEIPEAITEILDHREEYAVNCREFYRTQCRFEPYWERFCMRLQELSGLNLTTGAIDKESS